MGWFGLVVLRLYEGGGRPVRPGGRFRHFIPAAAAGQSAPAKNQ